MLAGVILVVPILRAYSPHRLYMADLCLRIKSSFLAHQTPTLCSIHFSTLSPSCYHPTASLFLPLPRPFTSWSCQNTMNPVKSGLASLPLGPRPMPRVPPQRTGSVNLCSSPVCAEGKQPRCICDQQEPRKGQAWDF